MKSASYSFCESSAAGPLSPWHIRALTSAGKKLSGGVDTESLCGHVTRKFGGWDLEAELRDDYPFDKVINSRRLVCKKCADMYRALRSEV